MTANSPDQQAEAVPSFLSAHLSMLRLGLLIYPNRIAAALVQPHLRFPCFLEATAASFASCVVLVFHSPKLVARSREKQALTGICFERKTF